MLRVYLSQNGSELEYAKWEVVRSSLRTGTRARTYTEKVQKQRKEIT